ncbi:MAG: sulfotransferase [Actinomycetota bacterium]|nr:sulfotransferase [Actinomycetota bacterium]
MRAPIAFLIVGTPRSGTTLLQRLACELPGVQVPPETHFFAEYVEDLLRRRTFPLDDAAVAEEVRTFLGRPNARGLELDEEEVVRALGGGCARALDLFSAIVRCLAGQAHLYGEKTPGHLRWWSPLTDALPDLKLLWIVRDPRAVVASALKVPWAENDVAALAEEWRLDHDELREAGRRLPPSRLLTLRYEEVVADPTSARRRIARFLGTAPLHRDLRVEELFLAWETWKSRVTQPITLDRVHAWKSDLSCSEAATVAAICARGMEELGYVGRGESVLARVRRVGLGVRHRRSRGKVRRNRRRERHRISRVAAAHTDAGQDAAVAYARKIVAVGAAEGRGNEGHRASQARARHGR